MGLAISMIIVGLKNCQLSWMTLFHDGLNTANPFFSEILDIAGLFSLGLAGISKGAKVVNTVGLGCDHFDPPVALTELREIQENSFHGAIQKTFKAFRFAKVIYDANQASKPISKALRISPSLRRYEPRKIWFSESPGNIFSRESMFWFYTKDVRNL
jgi:hypothetical protein